MLETCAHILVKVSWCGKVGNPSALGAEDRQFESDHRDHLSLCITLNLDGFIDYGKSFMSSGNGENPSQQPIHARVAIW